jgi:hypothetical protein
MEILVGVIERFGADPRASANRSAMVSIPISRSAGIKKVDLTANCPAGS